MAEGDVKQVIKAKLHSRRGRDLITFFVFVIISSGLWLVMSLNDTSQRIYSIHVEVEDLPHDESFYLENGRMIGTDGDIGIYTVVMKERGILLLKNNKRLDRALKLKFTDFRRDNNGVFYLSSAKMEAALQEYFGERAVIITWNPSVVAFKSVEVSK